MGHLLNDKTVKSLPVPPHGNKIYYDAKERGFGVRITKAGARSFVFNYRNAEGRERRYTIGAFPAWKTTSARSEALSLRQRVDRGEDPLESLRELRDAPTVRDLADRFLREHVPKKRAKTQEMYEGLVNTAIVPLLGEKRKVASIRHAHIEKMHRHITERGTRKDHQKQAPHQANRAVSVSSKMFSLAIKWGMRDDNPCKGIERNEESKRERYLTGAELARLTQALTDAADQQGANIIRMLMLTGARVGETMAAQWADFDLKAGVWTKPASTTKTRRTHRLPLSAPAVQLLSALRDAALPDAKYVFPGRHGGHRADIKKTWRAVCLAAGIVREESVKKRDGTIAMVKKPDARIHDLRHTYASYLASAGASLPLIGALLGHTQAATTQRYAHLLDDPQRQAAERVAAVMGFNPAPQADVIDADATRRK